MLSEVSWPIFLDYCSLFAPWYSCVITDNGCLLTIGNNGFECIVGMKTILSETENPSATESCNLHVLDSESSSNQSMT